MLARPMDVLTAFPVRKSKKQKQAFRDAVQSYAQSLGYSVTIEKGSLGSRNVVIGDPETAKYLVTAHYDTCARLPVPNLITPCNFWAFMAYQIFLAIVVFVPIILASMLVDFLTNNADLTFWVTEALLILSLVMIYVGPANKRNANDNTSGVVTVLEIARTLPENQRHKVCFVLFDLEEAGLIGSASYRKKHKKATDNQIVLNLDCVGDGDAMMMFPSAKLKKDRVKLTSLYKACGYFGEKSITVREKGFSFYPSDQSNFPYGVGICALNKSKFGYYQGRIHTPKDTVLEETNVNILRAALSTYISCDN